MPTRFKNIKDKKIRILTKVEDSDRSPKDLFGKSIWAAYRSMSGREAFLFPAGHIPGHIVSAMFTLNHHPEIKEGMYVLFREEYYKIEYVDDLEGYKSDMKLHCTRSSEFFGVEE